MSDGKSLPELEQAQRLRNTDEFLVNAQGQPRRASVAALFATRGLIHINDFGAVGDGISHPLSETYTSLKDAQAAYPAAQALTDEKDWCAWQAASDYVYARDDSPRPDNWSAGRFIADGNYIVNRTITFNHVGAIVEGTISSTRFATKGGTSITYRGPNGTIDDPAYIFDFYLFDEFQRGQPGGANYNSGAPPGRKGNGVYSGGGSFRVSHITFIGKGGDMRADAADVSGFVSGIRIRKGYYCVVSWCQFSGTLWDGIKFTDAQLFAKVENNTFYGVHRDAIAFDRAANFSTTTWLWWNEFGFVGRYAMLLDMSGSIEAMPIISDNSFEHTYDSFFTKHPEWFVQGLVSGVCVIGGGNAVIHKNRFESVTDQPPLKHWADLHFVATARPAIRDGIHRNLAFTALPRSAPWRSQPLQEYFTSHKRTDISDQRNYNIGTGRDHDDCDGIQVENIYNLGKILVADGVGLSTSNTHNARSVALQFWSIPIKDGAFARIVEPRPTAVLSLMPPPGDWNFTDVFLLDPNGARAIGQSGWAMADYLIYAGAGSKWAATTAYSLNALGTPLAENGFFYQVVSAGISAGTEPSWPRTIGQSVDDGSVKWKCIGRCSLASEARIKEWRTDGMRNRNGTAPPGTGTWAVGDKIWNTAPTAGGNIGWVCVSGGTPGTWKKFGVLEA